jgi:hypothetical protein
VGHKTEGIYRRYAIVDAAAQAAGVEKLALYRVNTYVCELEDLTRSIQSATKKSGP